MSLPQESAVLFAPNPSQVTATDASGSRIDAGIALNDTDDYNATAAIRFLDQITDADFEHAIKAIQGSSENDRPQLIGEDVRGFDLAAMAHPQNVIGIHLTWSSMTTATRSYQLQFIDDSQKISSRTQLLFPSCILRFVLRHAVEHKIEYVIIGLTRQQDNFFTATWWDAPNARYLQRQLWAKEGVVSILG